MKPMHEALMEEKAYPHKIESVDFKQTHISYVYITDSFVYKVKKPVNFGFLDFSTLEKRKFYCDQEVILNKRLSPHIYLGTVPVTKENDSFVFNGAGEAIDYAVKMKLIDESLMIRHYLNNNTLTPEIIDNVAKAIAEFHKNAETSEEIKEFGTIKTVKHNTDENFDQTVGYIGKSITQGQWDAIKAHTNNYFENKAHLFENRIKNNFIRDCHGDLHLDHICITDPITIFDCIEFNKRFRFSDVTADIAFLAMDLDFNNREDLTELLMKSYIKHSQDSEIMDLLTFYKIYRAYVRGKVISFQLDDPSISQEKKEEAAALASKYFTLAKKYVDEEGA